MTYTYAVLEISREAYDEIKAKLDAAGYQHAFDDDGTRIVIDMHGIALATLAVPVASKGHPPICGFAEAGVFCNLLPNHTGKHSVVCAYCSPAPETYPCVGCKRPVVTEGDVTFVYLGSNRYACNGACADAAEVYEAEP